METAAKASPSLPLRKRPAIWLPNVGDTAGSDSSIGSGEARSSCVTCAAKGAADSPAGRGPSEAAVGAKPHDGHAMPLMPLASGWFVARIAHSCCCCRSNCRFLAPTVSGCAALRLSCDILNACSEPCNARRRGMGGERVRCLGRSLMETRLTAVESGETRAYSDPLRKRRPYGESRNARRAVDIRKTRGPTRRIFFHQTHFPAGATKNCSFHLRAHHVSLTFPAFSLASPQRRSSAGWESATCVSSVRPSCP